MEIERKFLIEELPFSLNTFSVKQIVQGYLCTNPVVRIRREDNSYYLTYKSSGFLSRQEENLPLTRESFEHLLTKIDGLLIEKERYIIPLSAPLIAELDVFHGAYEGLVLVEVEFPSIKDANAFVPPAWFAKEVTNESTYQNSTLSQNSRK